MSRKIKKRIGRVCLYLMVFVIVLTVVAPFGWMVISSISTKADLLQRPMRWFPKNPSFENYSALLFGTSSRTTDAASQFLAALKNVPADLYEAAEIDGASKVKMFFSITVPQITPIIFFNLIMQTIQALQNFTSAFVITDGGPMKATYVLGMKLYKEGFSYFKMGYASAISWIIFIVIMLITLVLFATSKWWVFYGDES